MPSNAPAIQPKDRVLILKKNAPFFKIGRGDFLVYRRKETGARVFLHRVVALGGERLQFKEGNLYVSDSLVDTPQIPRSRRYANPPGADWIKENQVVDVPSGFYFVIGDNSTASADSRLYGAVSEADVAGKVIFISRDDEV